MFYILSLCLSTGWAAPERSSRIVGGEVTTIDNYPYTASLLKFIDVWFQSCAGTILTSTAIVSAARCFRQDPPSIWQARVGSNYAHSGGVLHNIRLITNHPGWDTDGLAFNVAMLRTATPILYSNSVQPARIAGPNYILPDGSSVFAAGWGAIAEADESSEQLKHVEVWTVNQDVCRVRYVEWAHNAVWFAVPELKDDMVCAGHLDVGGRGTCQGDYGGPLLHDGDVLYGITSWSEACGVASLPEIYTRVSDYTSWIVETAIA